MPIALGSRSGLSSPRDDVGECEGVATEQVDVLEAERMDKGQHPRDVHRNPLGADTFSRGLHVDRGLSYPLFVARKV